MLERNTLIKSGRASERRIVELKESLTEEKVRVAQLKENYENLKTDYENLRAQSQSEIQDFSNSLNQLILQVSTTKASAVKEYKTSDEFANIIGEEFFKSAAKAKTTMESHYPHFDYSFLEDDEDGD